MTRNQNHYDDTSSSSLSTEKRLKTFDKGDDASWSDLNYDVLLLIMMQLGVVDFVAFSRVCKSWRLLAVSNKNKLMALKPPLEIHIEIHANKRNYYFVEDFEVRIIKNIPLDPVGRTCVGLTCGYLIFFSRETRDFWLVNPITSHELHFPDYPFYVSHDGVNIKAILVFSPSISGWVLVVALSDLWGCETTISYCIVGKGRWNHVYPTLRILDLHFFKGKIYTLHKDCALGELRLHDKWMLLENQKFPLRNQSWPRLMSANEKLYVINWVSKPKMVRELNFGEMKWVSPEKTIEEYAIFVNYFKPCVAIKVESLTGPWTQYKSCDYYFLDTGKSRPGVFFYRGMLYFPHDCLNVNSLDE